VSRDAVTLTPATIGKGSIGLIGAGNFAKMTLVPAMKKAGLGDVRAVTSTGGLSARHLAERHDIPVVAADVQELLDREDIDTVFVLSRHDSHADLTSRALRAGKHVFVEKPLALTDEELDSVLEALATSGRQLWGGFNRRHSECITRTKEAVGADGGPLVITYRVSAGRLPDAHWYKDRRQGGRLLGEVCHFIDLASWVVGLPVDEIVAFGSRRAEALLQEDLVVSLRFADGSVATVSYAEFGHARTSKERLEVLGRGRSVVVDDFTKLLVDGKEVKLSEPGKGHVANLSAFKASLTGGASDADLRATIGSTAAALGAVESLLTGRVVKVDPRLSRERFA
jgi:predicted dehydrogenase